MINIPKIRLQTHRLVGSEFTNPADVVSWMGAVQAQQPNMAKVAVALRTKNGTLAKVEQELDKGSILRIHILRPTWHFIVPEDIRWMLDLSHDYMRRIYEGYAKQIGRSFTSQIEGKCFDAISRALQGECSLTRQEISNELEQAGLPFDNQFVTLLMSFAEIEGLVCSGRMQGNTHTYMLLDERVSNRNDKSHEESLMLLARKYFKSHSPAMLDDFTWWSGLSKTEAKRAIEMICGELWQENIADRTYYVHDSFDDHISRNTSMTLLPAYDEYLISYKYRQDVLREEHHPKAFTNFGIFYPVILSKGKVVGNWQKKGKKTECKFFEESPDINERTLKKVISEMERI